MPLFDLEQDLKILYGILDDRLEHRWNQTWNEKVRSVKTKKRLLSKLNNQFGMSAVKTFNRTRGWKYLTVSDMCKLTKAPENLTAGYCIPFPTEINMHYFIHTLRLLHSSRLLQDQEHRRNPDHMTLADPPSWNFLRLCSQASYSEGLPSNPKWREVRFGGSCWKPFQRNAFLAFSLYRVDVSALVTNWEMIKMPRLTKSCWRS